jgi:hypothetical protein
MKITVTSVVILAVCIVAAMLLLEGLRQVVNLPWPDGLESAIAGGVGALIWVLVMPRIGKAA